LSIANTGPAPVKIYSGEGIAQLIFLEASEVCQTSYGDRKGKYQAQKGIELSKKG
jgi:dCTP deaminase